MNQLNSKEPRFTVNAFFGAAYWMMEDTSSGLAAVLMALTMTVAPAVPSRFSAVPTSVWSALKLIQATASKQEYSIPTAAATRMTDRIMTIADTSGGR